MPKPLPGRRHSIQLVLRLLPEEAETLEDTARELGLTTTQLLRLLVRNASFLTVSFPPIAPD